MVCWEVDFCYERVDITVRGDLASRLGLCSFGVAVVVMMALLVSFSLEVKARIVMPVVV
jgi:hypothetical protein